MTFLLFFAKKTGLYGFLASSTGQLAEETNISQQSVSRKLQELEEQGYITRTVTPAGVQGALTDKGREKLRTLHTTLQHLFGEHISLKGIIKDGLGEGKFYMQQKGYTSQFEKILGFVPYPGTLNLHVDKTIVPSFLSTKRQATIAGFTTKERTFGGLQCYRISLEKNKTAAIIVPDRTTHSYDTVEIIAPVHLRSTLKLGNGDELAIN